MARIKVLICDDNEDTREGTRRLLEYEDDLEIVDFADNGLVAVNKVREHEPDVVLMDINMPGMNGIEATKTIKEERPQTQVIVVSVQDDMNYVRSAMRAGAVDFVPKPISGDDLTSAIRRAYETRQTAPAAPAPLPSGQQAQPQAGFPAQPSLGGRTIVDGNVVAVVGLKGGVGKTTIAVNLAVGIMRQAPEKKVVVIDGNMFAGDVAVSLNTRGQYNVVDAAAMATESELDEQGLEGVVVSHDSGIKLLIAPPNPLDSDPLSGSGMRNLIKELRKVYDYVIVDTGTAIDEVLVTIVQSADLLILATQATMPSLKDARIMSKLINELGGGEGDEDDAADKKQILVLNRYDRDNSRITPEQIGNFLKRPVSVTIPHDESVDAALNNGTPMITVDGRRAPAVAPLIEIVKLVRSELEQGRKVQANEEDQPRRTGLFSSFLGGN